MAASGFPVSLLVAGRPVLVVGGGRIGARKAEGLVRAGAAVTVVAPLIHPDLVDMALRHGPGTLRIDQRPYRQGEAAAYRLVVTATGVREVDGAVAADAEAAGVWVNSADDPHHCSFILPSIHRDGPVTVAVSTGGASPALATWLRRRVTAALGEGLGALATLLEEARHQLHDEGRSTESVDWQSLLDGALPELVARGDHEAARALIRSVTHPDNEHTPDTETP